MYRMIMVAAMLVSCARRPPALPRHHTAISRLLARPCSPQVPGLCAACIRHHACDGCAQLRCATPGHHWPCHACHSRPPHPPRPTLMCGVPTRQPAHTRPVANVNTTPFVFAWQRRPSRWPPRRGPRRSPSRSRCVISASLVHRPAHRSQSQDLLVPRHLTMYS